MSRELDESVDRLQAACVRRVWIAVAVVSVVVLAGCDWSQIGFGPAKTNANPYEPALTDSSVARLTVAWSQPSCFCLTPLVAGGVVYTAHFLAEVNPRPVELEALDEATGKPRWTFLYPRVNGAQVLAVGNGIAYVSVAPVSGPDEIQAFDASTGARRWTVTPPAPSSGPGQLGVDAGFVLDGDRLFVTAFANDGAGEVSAIDTTGRVVWSATPGGQVLALAADPGKTLYVASWVRTTTGAPVPLLTGLAETSGTRQSAVVPQQASTFSGPGGFAFGNGLIYDGGVAIRPDTGAVVWSAPNEIVMAVTANAVVMLAPGAIVARNPTSGSPLWFAPARAIVPQGVVVAGDLVFVGESGASDLQIRDLATGKLLGTSPPLTGGDYYISPSGGRVIIQAGGTLYALTPT